MYWIYIDPWCIRVGKENSNGYTKYHTRGEYHNGTFETFSSSGRDFRETERSTIVSKKTLLKILKVKGIILENYNGL
jgi:hypothetical protein